MRRRWLSLSHDSARRRDVGRPGAWTRPTESRSSVEPQARERSFSFRRSALRARNHVSKEEEGLLFQGVRGLCFFRVSVVYDAFPFHSPPPPCACHRQSLCVSVNTGVSDSSRVVQEVCSSFSASRMNSSPTLSGHFGSRPSRLVQCRSTLRSVRGEHAPRSIVTVTTLALFETRRKQLSSAVLAAKALPLPESRRGKISGSAVRWELSGFALLFM